jgi:Uma2 family endonuclease
MATGTLVSVDEYLNTSYSPDCDYVDGEIVERNVGEREHSELQTELAIYLGALRKRYGFHVFAEQRIQVLANRFRIPDVCVVLGQRPSTSILLDPPFLCIEILSKDDRYSAMREKIADYRNFGVKYVWVIDPRTRKADIYGPTGVQEAKDGLLSTSDPDISVSLPELYRSLE